MDSVNQDKKRYHAGDKCHCLTLPMRPQKNYKMQMPNVGEYDNDQKLEFEKGSYWNICQWSSLSDMEEKWKTCYYKYES